MKKINNILLPFYPVSKIKICHSDWSEWGTNERNGGIPLRQDNLNIIFNAIKRDPSAPIVARDDKKLNDRIIFLCYNFIMMKKEIKKTKLKPRTKAEVMEIDDELQLLKIEIADLKIIFKGRVELKRIMQAEKK